MNAITNTTNANLTIRSSEPSLSEGLRELLDSGRSTVIGPRTAADVRAYLDGPWPELALPDEERIDNMVARLAIATKERRITAEQHKERMDLYWRVLRNVPLVDLAAGFDRILATFTFMPTPAEVLAACRSFTVKREYRKSRARHLLWLHEKEYRHPTKPEDLVRPEDVAALRAQAAEKCAARHS